MIYINRGLILEQAIVPLLRSYFNDIHFKELYPNFNIAVEAEHPFARLYMSGGKGAADSFPCVVVSTLEDTKPAEFTELAPHIELVDINKRALESILCTTIDGKPIPGLCTVCSPSDIKTLQGLVEAKGMVQALDCRVRRHETIGIEVWATNNQLKNELYEAVRLYVTCYLRELLAAQYPFFDIALFDHNIRGQRGGNYNMDFALVLYGSHISIELNYMVEQLIVDAALEAPSVEAIISRAVNHSLP